MAISGKEYGSQPALPSSRIEEQVSAKVAYSVGVSTYDLTFLFVLQGYIAAGSRGMPPSEDLIAMAAETADRAVAHMAKESQP